MAKKLVNLAHHMGYGGGDDWFSENENKPGVVNRGGTLYIWAGEDDPEPEAAPEPKAVSSGYTAPKQAPEPEPEAEPEPEPTQEQKRAEITKPVTEKEGGTESTIKTAPVRPSQPQSYITGNTQATTTSRFLKKKKPEDEMKSLFG